jgi:hypothetical protein
MSGSATISNNTADYYGSGVYHNGSILTMKGSASVGSSSVVNSNVIYLPTGKVITLEGTFTGSARLTLEEPVEGRQVLIGSTGSTNNEKFSFTNNVGIPLHSYGINTSGVVYIYEIDTTIQPD